MSELCFGGTLAPLSKEECKKKHTIYAKVKVLIDCIRLTQTSYVYMCFLVSITVSSLLFFTPLLLAKIIFSFEFFSW